MLMMGILLLQFAAPSSHQGRGKEYKTFQLFFASCLVVDATLTVSSLKSKLISELVMKLWYSFCDGATTIDISSEIIKLNCI